MYSMKFDPPPNENVENLFRARCIFAWSRSVYAFFFDKNLLSILNDAENVHEANGIETKRRLIEAEGLVLVTNFHLLLMVDAREIHRVPIDDVYLLDGARFGYTDVEQSMKRVEGKTISGAAEVAVVQRVHGINLANLARIEEGVVKGF